ncbi:MAG: 6-phosphofructokinase [Planctomycetia bacterium]|nr:6-phosphofructokinase [Planctomycetia bacterium]
MPDKKSNAVIGQSGGPTAVINQSLVGVIEELHHHTEIDRILGAKYGVRGIINNDFIELNGVTAEMLERVAQTPSSALGSTRDKPDAAYCLKLLESFKKNNVGYFFYLGGNDSADTARIVSEMAEKEGYPLHVYHVPKTIDNDLRTTDHCPGFGSAARFVALAVMGDDLDNRSLKGIKIDIIMGRDAGWLTASTALPRQDENDGPHLIYVPEVNFSDAQFLADVDRVYTRLGRCVIAASEGIRYKVGDKNSLVTEKAMQGGEVDAHGNKQLSGTGALGDYLSEMVKSKLGIPLQQKTGGKLRVRADTFGYLQRSFPGIVSSSDAQEARQCGRMAVQYAITAPEGLTSGSVAIRRISDDPYKVDFFPTALSNVARLTKPLDTNYVIKGCDIGPDLIRYARPLVGPLPRPGRLF